MEKKNQFSAESCSKWLEALMKIVQFIINLVRSNKKSNNQTTNS